MKIKGSDWKPSLWTTDADYDAESQTAICLRSFYASQAACSSFDDTAEYEVEGSPKKSFHV